MASLAWRAMSDPISSRPRPPAARPTTSSSAGAAPQAASGWRAPFRRFVGWVRTSRLGQAFGNMFSARARSDTTRLHERSARAAAEMNAPAGARALGKPPKALAHLPEQNPSSQTLHRTPYGVAVDALKLLEGTLENVPLNRAQRGMVNEWQGELKALCLSEEISPRRLRAMLTRMGRSEGAPTELAASLTKMGKSIFSPAEKTRAAHAAFQQEMDKNLLIYLLDKPPPQALNASRLLSEKMLAHCDERYIWRGRAGEQEFAQLRQDLADRLRADEDWLLTELPDARRFIREPTRDNFNAMLSRTKSGADMMQQAWLFSQVMLMPEERAREWNARTADARMDQPFSLWQEDDFQRTHLGESLLSSAPPGAAAQLASAVFFGERNTPTRGGFRGEDFAMGHALMLAFTGRQSFAQSAHLMRALASDTRPTIVRAKTSKANALQLSAAPHAAEVDAARRSALRAPLPAYGKLAGCFQNAQTRQAIQDIVPQALQHTRDWVAERMDQVPRSYR